MKLYCPFSNGTSAMFWQETNCCRCRRSKCATRRALEACRDLTPHCVVIVGGTMREEKNGRFCTMPARCKSFTTTPVSKRYNPGKNTPQLFGEGMGHEPL